MPAPYASLSDRHHRCTSRPLTPLDLPCSAHLSPLVLDLAASSALPLGCRHLHDHTSLLDGTAPFLAKCLARSSTSSQPLFSLGQCRCLTPRSSMPLPPSPPHRRLDMVTSTFDTSSSSWTTPQLFLKCLTSSLMPHVNMPPSHQNASTLLGNTSLWLCPLIDSTAALTFSNPSLGCLSDVLCTSLFPLLRPQSSYPGLVLLSSNSLELRGFFELS